LVWLDAEPGESTADEWHAHFRLSPDTGTLALVKVASGQSLVLDYVHYARLEPGQSMGLVPDGNLDRRQVSDSPTPAAANALPSLPRPVVINEWMAANRGTLADPADGDFEDWIELHNPNDTPADLTGYFLTDDISNPRQYAIPGRTLIPARGYLLIWADAEPAQNTGAGDLHASFRLNREGDTISLLDPDQAVIDSVHYGSQGDDISEGRWPDAAPPPFASMMQPTPREPNRFSPDPAVPRMTELVFLPDGTWRITWSAQPGATYQLQSKEQLDQLLWQNVAEPVAAPAAASTASQTDPNPNGHRQRFYRVLRLAPAEE
jgi:hypothetical protein